MGSLGTSFLTPGRFFLRFVDDDDVGMLVETIGVYCGGGGSCD